jgi:hypothetical protein
MQQARVTPMPTKLLMMIAVFAAAHTVAFAQDEEPRGDAPKPTLEEVQKLVQAISTDTARLKTYCELGKLQGRMENAIKEHNEEALSSLLTKMEGLEDDLGPDFAKVSDGLESVDANSSDGEKFAEVFGHLNEKCKEKSRPPGGASTEFSRGRGFLFGLQAWPESRSAAARVPPYSDRGARQRE